MDTPGQVPKQTIRRPSVGGGGYTRPFRYYSHVAELSSSPWARENRASRTLRNPSAQLSANVHVVPPANLSRAFTVVPPAELTNDNNTDNSIEGASEYDDDSEGDDDKDEDRGSCDDKEATALQWRMCLCALAITLLWATTLTTAESIINNTSIVPSFSSVYNTCEFAYNEVIVQEKWYEECANHQLETCAASFEAQLQEGVTQLTEKQQQNKDVYEEIISFQQTCASNLKKLFTTLEAFSSQISPPNQIVYQESCPSNTQARVQTKLGDRSVDTISTLSHSAEYVQNSQDTINSLASYSSRLTAYNAAYLANKTAHIRSELREQMLGISSSHIWGLNDTLADLTQQVEQLVACISLDTTSPPSSSDCPGFPSPLVNLYTNAQVWNVRSNKHITNTIDKMTEEAETLYANAVNAMESANDFYDSISTASGAMQWINNNLVSLYPGSLSLCTVGPVPSWCSYTRSMWYVRPYVLPDVPLLYNIPLAGEMWNQVASGVSAALAANQQTMGSVLSNGHDWSDSLLDIIDQDFLAFHDYHPPEFDVDNSSATPDDVVAAHSHGSESFMNTMAQHIANLTAALQSDDSLVNISQFAFQNTDSSASNLLSEHSFSFQPLTLFENIHLLEFFDKFSDLKDLLRLLDIVLRLFQTIRLLRQYWDKSAVSVLDLDMTEDCAGVQGGSFLPKGVSSFLYGTLTVFGYVWVSLCVLIVAVGILTFQVAALYLPTYSEYQSSCVNHQHNGSFLASNLNAGAFNYASDNGHTTIFKGLSDYNALSAETCSQYVAVARNSFDLLMKDVVTAATAHESVANDAQLVQSCVNLTEMDGLLMLSSSAPLQSYFVSSSPTLATSSNTHSSSASNSVPVVLPESCTTSLSFQGSFIVNVDAEAGAGDTTAAPEAISSGSGAGAKVMESFIPPAELFNCSDVLPACTITCSGPEPEMFQVMTERCACMTEWLVHSSLLHSLAVFLVYLLLNVSRYCLCRALALYLWRRLLTPESPFLFRGSCNTDGTILLPPPTPIPTSATLLSSVPVSIFTAAAAVVYGKTVGAEKRKEENGGGGAGEEEACFDLDIIYADVRGQKQEQGQEQEQGQQRSEQKVSLGHNRNHSTASMYQQELQHRLAASLLRVTFRGHMFLVAAVLVNLPWVLLLALVNSRLDYHPTASPGLVA